MFKYKIGDIVSFTGDIYKYEITDIYGNWYALENLLTHKYSEINYTEMKDKIKIERRSD